ncbi:hypothetical protein [Methanobacterium alcaliphilum]|uniref:hypothetical protein n=1 Tax=Methanobacterium alcaliphilum TaxID=392018 RepID=UPI002009ED69|nr:hypothetical protein [Methanobacterium alcaliphilum]MCK9150702.1 hypothetical protein [Methanobacterium alcaliphilum]
MGHKQVDLKINDDFFISVDQGMEDIIRNFFRWEIETCNSCIDYKGSVWIEFCEYADWEKFLQLTLRNNIAVKGYDSKKETLWDFLQEKSKVNLVFDEELMIDPNQEDNYIGTGVLIICVGLKFPKELLNEFSELLFEVMPPK